MDRIVTVNELKEGMTISQPVKNRFGQLIIVSDQKIELKHLNVLKIWGIHSVTIEGESDNEYNQQINEEIRNEAERILQKRINWLPENLFEKELYEFALMKIIQKLQ